MGNCIDVLSQEPAEKSTVLVYNGEEKEFKASTQVKKIVSGGYRRYKIVHHALPFSPLPSNTKLEAGELYYLVPPFVKPKSASQETHRKQKVKIVLTRQQLQFLLRNAKEFKSKGFTVGFSTSFREENRKWQPSLATIQEVE
ncbi:hypothetical protein JCGZ_13686 [Jatropha curcas]|uniref:Uncharacterized protein n=1 Tax=Jatropha curcas TaxID=180498 RepID=A0A067KKV0_JATCU|nr:hypothetical protein JCGZ_13686 [Jatropha curcas]